MTQKFVEEQARKIVEKLKQNPRPLSGRAIPSSFVEEVARKGATKIKQDFRALKEARKRGIEL